MGNVWVAQSDLIHALTANISNRAEQAARSGDVFLAIRIWEYFLTQSGNGRQET